MQTVHLWWKWPACLLVVLGPPTDHSLLALYDVHILSTSNTTDYITEMILKVDTGTYKQTVLVCDFYVPKMTSALHNTIRPKQLHLAVLMQPY